jgi:hypothetical protein
MEILSLYSLLKTELEESEVYDYLSSFTCAKNPDVESFLHKHAINNEKRSFSRTFLVIDETTEKFDIIGYFTLLIKNFKFTDVSGTTRNKLTGNRRATSFNTVLIAQLGRADKYKGIVPGKDILELALEKCSQVNTLAAVRVACVEYEDIPILCDFYESNGFTLLQKNENGYLISYVRI